MTGILLTKSSTFIIGPVATALGWLMDWIYEFLSTLFNIQNVGLAIILFTIVIYLLMIPLTYNQQKFQKLSAVMQPEIKAIQAKYKGKKDVDASQKMNEEMKLVHEKYGTSSMGGCVQLLIQMPILFGLYQVIQNMPAYVTQIKESYAPLIEKVMESDGYVSSLETIVSDASIHVSSSDYTQVNTLVDIFYKFQTETWSALLAQFPSLENIIASTQASVAEFNFFLGIDIANSPFNTIMESYTTNMGIAAIALMIPVLAGISQYLSIKISQNGQQMDMDNPMASSMKTMTTTMPLISVFFCFSLPAGLGLYWIVSAVVRTIQQVVIKMHLDKQPLEEMIEKNRAKAAKKREKKGIKPTRLNEMAQKNAKKIEDYNKVKENEIKNKKDELRQRADEVKNNKNPKNSGSSNNNDSSNAKSDKPQQAKPKSGSLASKANMVKDYNEGNK